MKIEAFQLERWQSVWENQVELNIAESGVEPLTLRELRKVVKRTLGASLNGQDADESDNGET